MIVTVTLEGQDKLAAILDRGPQAAHLAAQALFVEASEVFAQSQFQTPVRTGMLRASGHVKPVSADSEGAQVEIAYGGAAAPYAIYVHERLDVSHDPPTKAKFLEDPVSKAAPALISKIVAAVEAGLGV